VATRSKISVIRHVRKHVLDEQWRVESWLTVDEGVQDGHGAVGDTSVRVDLLEDCGLNLSQHVLAKRRGWAKHVRKDASKARLTLVDVRRVRLLAGLGALLLVTAGGSLLAGILLLRSLGGSGRGLGGGLLVSGLGSHFDGC
jgi:hypothetical protein